MEKEKLLIEKLHSDIVNKLNNYSVESFDNSELAWELIHEVLDYHQESTSKVACQQGKCQKQAGV